MITCTTCPATYDGSFAAANAGAYWQPGPKCPACSGQKVASMELPLTDWRIGLSVTPKMRTHYWFRHLAVVRKVYQASAGMQEMIDVELYHGDGETTILREPSEEWMTA